MYGLDVASPSRRRSSTIFVLVCFVVVVTDFIGHQSAVAADAADADIAGVFTRLGDKHLDKDENDLILAAKALAEKRDVGNTFNVKETSHGTDRVKLLPRSDQGNSHLLSLMLDVTRRVSGLQDAVADMRQENKLSYRQLKRHLLKLSSAGASSQNSRNRLTNFNSRPQSFVQSAAFHADRPQADQHEPLRQNQHQQETVKVAESETKPEKEQQQQSSTVSQRSRCAKGFEFSVELNSCYRMTGERTTWRMARQRCRQLNADLTIVDSAQEQRYINLKARSNPDTRHCDFWIGLVRGRGGVDGSSSSSSWHWVGDIGNARTPSYTNWNINEPNNANSYEHCTQMLWIFSWRWNDAHCNYGNACYVCQAKPTPRL